MKYSIKKEGKIFVVRAVGATHLAKVRDVDCVNPRAPERSRVYVKRFANKPIFLAREYKRAYEAVLAGPDVLVIGMNGYSILTEEQCRAWGVQVGGYEAACGGIQRSTYREVLEQIPEIDVRYAHGASYLGIDGVIIRGAKKLKRPHLGHSCPQFMFYVDDDDVPVYVAANKQRYSDAFIKSLHVLIACNGRKQAFDHDWAATFHQKKHLVPLNVLKSISTNGGPPAVGPDGEIEDAVAFFEQRVHMITQQFVMVGGDQYGSLVKHIAAKTVVIARQTISPEIAFAHVKA